MKKPAPPELLTLAAHWAQLGRWDRAELARSLRRLGWTYGEIMEALPVPKTTLAGWCRGIRLSNSDVAAIKQRTYGSRRGVPVDTQWRRREEIEKIRQDATERAMSLVADPIWVAGVVLYWGEGAKTSNELSLSNSDPRALRLFIGWVWKYHSSQAEFALKINLHADNDEKAARRFWREQSGLVDPTFHKTYIKPDGTGHRKNSLPFGVCMARMRRSADALHATLAWIDVVADRSDLSHC